MALGGCESCFASNNDKSDQVKTRSYAQEKEIDMCSEKLKKQLDEINELKSMSKDSYYWYRCKRILKSFLKFALKCGITILANYGLYKIGYNTGLAEGPSKYDFSNRFNNFFKGYNRGYADGQRSCPRGGGGVPLSAKETAFIKKFIKVSQRKIHPDAFSGKDKKSKIKANLEDFSKNLNNLQECMEKGDCNPNNLK